MFFIIGLGNPGQKFQKTRHNVGFRVVDEFVRKNNFSNFKISKKSNSLISEGLLNNQKIVLAKPQTFMNNSGKAVKLLTKPYTLTSKNLIVIHDDIDLPLGKIRIAIGRGAAGHKGVESIIKELKTKNFVRFRIGIKLKQSYRPVYRTEKFVLQKFDKEEEKIIKEVIKKISEAIEVALTQSLAKAMSKYNN